MGSFFILPRLSTDTPVQYPSAYNIPTERERPPATLSASRHHSEITPYLPASDHLPSENNSSRNRPTNPACRTNRSGEEREYSSPAQCRCCRSDDPAGRATGSSEEPVRISPTAKCGVRHWNNPVSRPCARSRTKSLWRYFSQTAKIVRQPRHSTYRSKYPPCAGMHIPYRRRPYPIRPDHTDG